MDNLIYGLDAAARIFVTLGSTSAVLVLGIMIFFFVGGYFEKRAADRIDVRAIFLSWWAMAIVSVLSLWLVLLGLTIAFFRSINGWLRIDGF